MAYMIDKEKDYAVKGSLLIALQELLQIYKCYPMLELQKDNEFKIGLSLDNRDDLFNLLVKKGYKIPLLEDIGLINIINVGLKKK